MMIIALLNVKILPPGCTYGDTRTPQKVGRYLYNVYNIYIGMGGTRDHRTSRDIILSLWRPAAIRRLHRRLTYWYVTTARTSLIATHGKPKSLLQSCFYSKPVT